ncbi:MAG: hypothetical protein QXI58_00385 [Candidatus Micrarchaeia archaeon]
MFLNILINALFAITILIIGYFLLFHIRKIKHTQDIFYFLAIYAFSFSVLVPLELVRIAFHIPATFIFEIPFVLLVIILFTLGNIPFLKNLSYSLAKRINKIVYKPYILDTNVIIDGRIFKLIEMKLLQGIFIIPGYVIDELDIVFNKSKQEGEKARIREAFNKLSWLLNEASKYNCIQAYIKKYNFPRKIPNDQKLLMTTKLEDGVLVTSDYILHSLAKMRQIDTILFTDVITAIHPTIGVGDELTVKIVEKGEKPEQGVGYLENGTRVIVTFNSSKEAEQHMNKIMKVKVLRIVPSKTNRILLFCEPIGVLEETT